MSTIDYNIDASNYLPEFLKDSERMCTIMDCLNVLISTEQPYFEAIQEAYNDTLYKTRDYSKLSYNAKVAVINELGFDYLLDILSLTNDQLTKLLIFFNLIYLLKGKKEGLGVCLEALGFTDYSYTTWKDTSPRGAPFTATLIIVGDNYNNDKVIRKLKNFVRSYMLPWIDITISITVQGPSLYLYNSMGRLIREWSPHINTASRDFSDEVSIVAPTEFLDKNYVFDSYEITVNGPEGSTITINGESAEETLTKAIPMGTYFRISVAKDGYKTYTNHYDLCENVVVDIEKLDPA